MAIVIIRNRSFDTEEYAVPQTLPSKEEFVAWLKALPPEHVFCSGGRSRCKTCPIGEWTGKYATYGALEGTWAAEFMLKFDNNRVYSRTQTAADALRIAQELWS